MISMDECWWVVGGGWWTLELVDWIMAGMGWQMARWMWDVGCLGVKGGGGVAP